MDILRRAYMAFRKIFLEREDVSVRRMHRTTECMYFDYRFHVYESFRKNFLHREKIGIIPPGGYKYKDNHSYKALQWLM